MEALPNKVKDLSMEMHEMHTAIEELAEHIVEPVAAKLSTEELCRILSRINYAFNNSTSSIFPATPTSKISLSPSLGQFNRCLVRGNSRGWWIG